MRTKALLLAAAFAAAGITTQAQVFSVNAVGYINFTLPPGFVLVGNQLDAGAGNNTVAKLFSNITPSVPVNSKVFIFDNPSGLFKTVTFSPLSKTWGPPGVDGADRVINPGQGVFFQNPTASPITVTFVGEVKQGTVTVDLPLGFSIVANPVPQEGKPDSFGLPGVANDKLFRFNNGTSLYDTFTFSPLSKAWNPVLPSMPVGEAFYIFRATSAGTWTRNFNVNNPTT